MNNEEKKQKHREAMRKWRLANPDRNRANQKKYESKPERKASKRRRMAEWRKKNPEKQKEISKKSYMNYMERNRGKRNEARRIKWAQDERFRNRVLKKAKYRYQNRRSIYCVICGENTPRHSSKYCDKCRNNGYKQKNKDWRIKVGGDYINELQNKRVKKKVDEITDGYIAGLLRGNKLTGLKLTDIPKELIELKRNVLKIKRIIKTKNNETRTNL